MFDIPGFDTSIMSDTELLNKQLDLSQRFALASRFGSMAMNDQLRMMLQAIEMEQRSRMMAKMFVARQEMFPDIIETDPDLAALHKKKVQDSEDDSMAQRRRIGRERVTLKKSSPIIPLTKEIKKDRKDNG